MPPPPATRSAASAALFSLVRKEAPPVIYSDRVLVCVDCGVDFIHSAADQEYFLSKGFGAAPKRCPSCRAYRRALRDTSPRSSGAVATSGGPRGYERSGGDQREYFVAICTGCGNQAQVPFRPRSDKPVYCSDCFRTIRPD
jgi:CxxC-x17-CxxC domain-containing protein